MSMPSVEYVMTHSAFVSGLVDEEQRRRLMSSIMWPVVTGIRAIAKQKLFICESKHWSLPNDMDATLCTDWGGIAFRVYMDTEGLITVAMSTGSPDTYNFNKIIESTKPAYIIKRLSETKPANKKLSKYGRPIKRKHDVSALGGSVETYLDALLTKFRNQAYKLVENVLYRGYKKCVGDQRDLNLTARTQTALVNVYRGKMPMIGIPADVQVELDGFISQMEANKAKIKEFTTYRRENFAREKWMAVAMPYGGIVIGKVDFSCVFGSMRDEDPAYNVLRDSPPIQLANTMRVYATINDVPADIYHELHGALTFEKMARQGSDSLEADGITAATRSCDPNRLLPLWGDKVYEEAGAIAYNFGYGVDTGAWYVCNA